MDILPAIDIRNGKCVRLIQGNYQRQIDYADDPIAQAQTFQQQGAKWLHIVDLDGAKDGKQYHVDLLDAIRRATTLHIEVGGGIRSETAIQTLLDTGINRVIIGTRALQEMDWFKKIVFKYPNQIVLGLDARDGKLSAHGWTKTSDITAESMAQTVSEWPLAAIVYTDIARDGMLTGPNIPATEQLCHATRVPIIASGGVGSLKDIAKLQPLPLAGVIVGRALYEGNFTLPQAITTATGESAKQG